MTDAEFLAAFEACTIPKADWTHEAHVRMAWLYLTSRPFPDALQRIRTGIRRYNDSLGGTGYHDTITVALTRLIASRLVGDGYRVRVYVPFGREWFPYFMRRLGERPANIAFVVRGILGESG